MLAALKSRHVKRQVLLLLGVYQPPVHAGIARYAGEHGWVVDPSYAESGHPPLGWDGDGMITLITAPKDYTALRRFPQVPIVDISKGWVSNVMPPKFRQTGVNQPRVLYDNVKIGELAAKHFLERGFKNIIFFNYGNYWLETDRLPAFRATIEQAGVEFIELAYYKYFKVRHPHTERNEHAAFRWLVESIRKLPKPVGVFACTDHWAVKVLYACDVAKVSVPEEVAVLGCDNQPLICDYAPIPLSSVDNDLEGLGYEAARLLDRLMDGKVAPKQPILIPPKGVVQRQSTNVLAVPDVRIARAVRFIWEHFQETIGTVDVAAAAGVSRRVLERAFMRYVGRSVAAEIQQHRIEQARKLLLETTLKAHEIATRTGFSGLVHFSLAFRRVVGISPRHYRNQHKSREG